MEEGSPRWRPREGPVPESGPDVPPDVSPSDDRPPARASAGSEENRSSWDISTDMVTQKKSPPWPWETGPIYQWNPSGSRGPASPSSKGLTLKGIPLTLPVFFLRSKDIVSIHAPGRENHSAQRHGRPGPVVPDSQPAQPTVEAGQEKREIRERRQGQRKRAAEKANGPSMGRTLLPRDRILLWTLKEPEVNVNQTRTGHKPLFGPWPCVIP
jgi:hypothetical protein